LVFDECADRFNIDLVADAVGENNGLGANAALMSGMRLR